MISREINTASSHSPPPLLLIHVKPPSHQHTRCTQRTLFIFDPSRPSRLLALTPATAGSGYVMLAEKSSRAFIDQLTYSFASLPSGQSCYIKILDRNVWLDDLFTPRASIFIPTLRTPIRTYQKLHGALSDPPSSCLCF